MSYSPPPPPKEYPLNNSIFTGAEIINGKYSMLYDSNLITRVSGKYLAVIIQEHCVLPHLSLGYSLPSSSVDGAIMSDAPFNNFPHYVVSDIFYGDNCSQHYGEMQYTFS